jgi:hypothetical protein
MRLWSYGDTCAWDKRAGILFCSTNRSGVWEQPSGATALLGRCSDPHRLTGGSSIRELAVEAVPEVKTPAGDTGVSETGDRGIGECPIASPLVSEQRPMVVSSRFHDF